MKSPHSAIPDDQITRTSTGWLYSCDCGHENHATRRPGADMAAWEHRKTHARPAKEE